MSNVTFGLLVPPGLLGAAQVLLCGPTLPAWVPRQETSGSSLSTLAKDTRCRVRPSQPRPPSPEGNEVPPYVRLLLRLHWTALACLRLAVSPCPVGVSGAHPQPGATAEATSAGAPGEQAPGAGTGLHGPDSCPVPSLNSVRRRSALCGRLPALSFHRSLGGGRFRRPSGRLTAGFPRSRLFSRSAHSAREETLRPSWAVL